MNFLTNILFWISTALLIPVVVVLLFSLIGGLILLGGFYGQYMARSRRKAQVQQLIENIQNNLPCDEQMQTVTANRSPFAAVIRRLQELHWKAPHADKLVADFEQRGEKDLGFSRTLMRVGPMLGLMGTLIPMGPALVGLASGDIGSMAVNMQVAFSTTVVGIFVGAIGFMTQLSKQRWLVEETNDLLYLLAIHSTPDTKE